MVNLELPRAVIADQFGQPEDYRLLPVERPKLDCGQARIAIKAAGISFVDVLTAAGKYQVKPPLPFIPGSECSGVILELGSQSSPFSVGDHVVASGWGGIICRRGCASH